MLKLSLKQIANILNADFQGGDVIINGVATDSREVKPGNLFITWKGDQFDGRQFCAQAITNGAAACLVTEKQNLSVPQIIVSDSIKAFGKIAAYWRDQFNIPIIGVTGSNGKTTVKNMLSSIFHVAAGEENCLAPQKSYNNHVGVPLTLSLLSSKHQYAVIEMGMNHFGELSYLTHLARPNVTVITNAGPSHLAGVGGTLAGVAKAKGEIMEGLQTNGVAVLNADDQFFEFWKQQAENHKVLSFGIEHQADIMAKNIHSGTEGSTFTLVAPGEKVEVILPLLGEHNILNSLAAAAVAISAGIDLQDIIRGLSQVKPEPHRLELKKHKASGALIIDDCYNANPNSMRRAIDVLMQFPGEHIAVLGDMRELGEDEVKFHLEIGEYAKKAGVKKIFAVGDLMENTIKSFGGEAKHFPNNEQLLQYLESHLQEDDVALIKSSKSMKLMALSDMLTK